jgi:hypothetical protein
MKNWKKYLFIVMATFLLICLGVSAAEVQTKFIRRIIDNVIYDNRNHYLSCEQLPTVSEVMQVVEEHQGVTQEIEQVKPGFVGMEIDIFSCPGKADIVFWYGGHQDRIVIESIINAETFFGVPYRLHNR